MRCVVGPHTHPIAEHSFLADVVLSYPQVFDSELCWLVLFTSLHALDEEEEAKHQTVHGLLYQVENKENEARYQSALCLRYQDENEVKEARHQTTLCLWYKAKNKED